MATVTLSIEEYETLKQAESEMHKSNEDRAYWYRKSQEVIELSNGHLGARQEAEKRCRDMESYIATLQRRVAELEVQIEAKAVPS